MSYLKNRSNFSETQNSFGCMFLMLSTYMTIAYHFMNNSTVKYQFGLLEIQCYYK